MPSRHVPSVATISLSEVLAAEDPLPFPIIDDAAFLVPSGKCVYVDHGLPMELRSTRTGRRTRLTRLWAEARSLYQQGFRPADNCHVSYCESGASAYFHAGGLRVPLGYLAHRTLLPKDLPGRVVMRMVSDHEGHPAVVVDVICAGAQHVQVSPDLKGPRRPHDEFRSARHFYVATDSELADLAALRAQLAQTDREIDAWWADRPTLAQVAPSLGAPRESLGHRAYELPGVVVRRVEGFAQPVHLYRLRPDEALIHMVLTETYRWQVDRAKLDTLFLVPAEDLSALQVLVDRRLDLSEAIRAWWRRPSLAEVLRQMWSPAI